MIEEHKYRGVLHLDEILGRQAMIVAWQGKEYSLKTSADLSPDEYMSVMAVGEKFSNLQSVAGSEKMSAEIISAVDKMIEIIAPELASINLSFAGRVKVLEFWREEENKAKKTMRAGKKS